MYGGKFLPFHRGHRYCAEFAAGECEIVYVILFYGGPEEEIICSSSPKDWLSVEARKAAVERMCRELNLSKKLQRDTAITDDSVYEDLRPAFIDISKLRLPDGTEDWEAETPLVRKICGERLDAVYSSEPGYGDYFSHAYPEAVHRLVDVPRIHVPISGTRIREMADAAEQKKWLV